MGSRLFLSIRPLRVVSSLAALFTISIIALPTTQLAGQALSAPPASVSPLSTGLSFFEPVLTFEPNALNSSSLAVADFNRDGNLDVVVASCEPAGSDTCGNNGNLAGGVLSILLGKGNGTFLPAKSYPSGGAMATSVTVADVNRDGKLDLIASNCRPLGSMGGCGFPQGGLISVLKGNGDGTFRKAVTYPSGGVGPVAVQVGDVNNDGKPDIVVANNFNTYYNSTSGLLGVLLGNGDGTFQKAVTYPSGRVGANSVIIADVNGDNKPDLLVSNGDCPNTSDAACAGVLLGNGDGTFQPVVLYRSGGGEATSIAVADVNGDQKPDLLVTDWCIFCLNHVAVLLGSGDGTFEPPVTYTTGGYGAWSLAVGDVNADQKPDLVVANQCPGTTKCTNSKGMVGVLLGNGDGTFQSPQSYLSGGSFASAIVATDLNEDARTDVMVLNGGGQPIATGSLGVLLNKTGDVTPPAITLNVTPTVLWPPNGDLVPVTLSGSIIDPGFGFNIRNATYVVNDEYKEIHLKGHPTLDADGNYSVTVSLPASRHDTDLNGRRYTVIVFAVDRVGLSSSVKATVIVPHLQP